MSCLQQHLNVTMNESLDKNDIDFQINEKPIQLKSKYSYETGFEEWATFEDYVFVVNYDSDIIPFIKNLLEYLSLDFALLSEKIKSSIQMIWLSYMSYYGILEGKTISKKQRKKMMKGYVIPISSGKPFSKTAKDDREKESMKENFQVAYKVYKESGRFPKGYWNDKNKEILVGMFQYILTDKGINITTKKDINRKLISECGLYNAYMKIYGTTKVQPIRDDFFGGEKNMIIEDEIEMEQTNVTTIIETPPEPKEESLVNNINLSNIDSVIALSEKSIEKYKCFTDMILSDELLQLMKKNYSISKDKWIKMSVQNATIVIEKTLQISELLTQLEQVKQKINDIIEEVKDITSK